MKITWTRKGGADLGGRFVAEGETIDLPAVQAKRLLGHAGFVKADDAPTAEKKPPSGKKGD